MKPQWGMLCWWFLFVFFFHFLKSFFTWGYAYCFEREGEKEKHWLIASHTHHDLGSNLQPRYVSWWKIEPANFWCLGQWSNQLNNPTGAPVCFYSNIEAYFNWTFFFFFTYFQFYPLNVDKFIHFKVSKNHTWLLLPYFESWCYF